MIFLFKYCCITVISIRLPQAVSPVMYPLHIFKHFHSTPALHLLSTRFFHIFHLLDDSFLSFYFHFFIFLSLFRIISYISQNSLIHFSETISYFTEKRASYCHEKESLLYQGYDFCLNYEKRTKPKKGFVLHD